MVCIYCGRATAVSNSRLQKRRNSVWRRRRCVGCGAVFTSVEQTDYEQSLGFVDGASHIVPFRRDALYVSLYEACRHREGGVSDAAALADTILQQLLRGFVTDGMVERSDVVRVTYQTLANFDAAAASAYRAYHPVKTS